MYLDPSVIYFFLLTKRGEMDIYVDKSDAVWKWEQKDWLEHNRFQWGWDRVCWFSKCVICMCFSSQAAGMRHLLLSLACCHGNADRVIWQRCSIKKKNHKKQKKECELHYCIKLCSILDSLKFFKGLFSSTNQGIVPYSLCARIQLMSTWVFCVDRASPWPWVIIYYYHCLPVHDFTALA